VTNTTPNLFISLIAFLLSALVIMIVWNLIASTPIGYGEALLIGTVTSLIGTVGSVIARKIR
jgi:hypothetical protein